MKDIGEKWTKASTAFTKTKSMYDSMKAVCDMRNSYSLFKIRDMTYQKWDESQGVCRKIKDKLKSENINYQAVVIDKSICKATYRSYASSSTYLNNVSYGAIKGTDENDGTTVIT